MCAEGRGKSVYTRDIVVTFDWYLGCIHIFYASLNGIVHMSGSHGKRGPPAMELESTIFGSSALPMSPKPTLRGLLFQAPSYEGS